MDIVTKKWTSSLLRQLPERIFQLSEATGLQKSTILEKLSYRFLCIINIYFNRRLSILFFCREKRTPDPHASYFETDRWKLHNKNKML